MAMLLLPDRANEGCTATLLQLLRTATKESNLPKRRTETDRR
jgi:hypothetical protein